MDPEAGDFKRAALPTHGELNFGVCCHGVKSSGFCSVNRSPTAVVIVCGCFHFVIYSVYPTKILWSVGEVCYLF